MKLIPRERIRHLEWQPGEEVAKVVEAPKKFVKNTEIDLAFLVNGEEIYDNNMAKALDGALLYESILTMPELIYAKTQVDKKHKYWQNWFTVHTEENIGIDKDGIFYGSNKPVLVIVNGGGLLTPEKIKQSYKDKDGLIYGSVKYTPEEFNDLLKGKLPNGDSINIYKIEDVKDGIVIPHNSGIVMPYDVAKNTVNGYHKKSDFMKNTLVIARNGGLSNLEQYFEITKDSDEEVGNHHVYASRDPTQAQGRLLFLYSGNDGLDGSNYLNYGGRFIGVGERSS